MSDKLTGSELVSELRRAASSFCVLAKTSDCNQRVTVSPMTAPPTWVELPIDIVESAEVLDSVDVGGERCSVVSMQLKSTDIEAWNAVVSLLVAGLPNEGGGSGSIPLLRRGGGSGSIPLLSRGGGSGSIPLHSRGGGSGSIPLDEAPTNRQLLMSALEYIEELRSLLSAWGVGNPG